MGESYGWWCWSLKDTDLAFFVGWIDEWELATDSPKPGRAAATRMVLYAPGAV